jgi:hypothetical protein
MPEHLTHPTLKSHHQPLSLSCSYDKLLHHPRYSRSPGHEAMASSALSSQTLSACQGEALQGQPGMCLGT